MKTNELKTSPEPVSENVTKKTKLPWNQDCYDTGWRNGASHARKEALREVCWVSVEESLPEHDTECLCYAESGLYMCSFWNERTQEWDAYNRGTAQWEQFIFTHWMPLPAPPITSELAEGSE